MVQVSIHMQPALVIPVETCTIAEQKCNSMGRKVTWLGCFCPAHAVGCLVLAEVCLTRVLYFACQLCLLGLLKLKTKS